MDIRNKLLKKIDDLRCQLNYLVDQKDTLTDQEIIIISKKLDELLNEYMKT